MTQLKKIEATIKELLPRTTDLTDALDHLRLSIAFKLWRHQNLRSTIRSSKILAYDCGCASEAVFLLLCELDGVEGDDKVRKARKTLVLQLKEMIKDLDSLRHSAFRVQRFVVTKMAQQTEPVVATAKAVESAVACEEKVKVASVETVEDTGLITKAEPVKAEPVKAEPVKAEPVKAEPAESSEEDDFVAPLRKKVKPTRWYPNKRETRFPDKVQIFISVPGVNESSLAINLKHRSIIISGRKNKDPATVFHEKISIPPSFNLAKVTCDFLDNELILTLPFTRQTRSTRPAYHNYRCVPHPHRQSTWFKQGGVLPFF